MLKEAMEMLKKGNKMPGDQPSMSMNEDQYGKMCEMSEQLINAGKEIKAMAEMMYGKKSEMDEDMYEEDEGMEMAKEMPKKGMDEDKKKALVIMMKKSMQA